jgi:hypothetical protein
LTSLIGHIPVRIAFVVAVAVCPWLIARLFAGRVSGPLFAALVGTASLILNTAVPVALHVLHIPIRGGTLAAAHGLIFVPVVLAAWLQFRMRSSVEQVNEETEWRRGKDVIVWLGLVLAIGVFPFTHLAGIDTYKFQDLATAVRVDQSVPWLIHPLSLVGFTPHSYTSVQPLTLASIQILGGLGVDGGYYVMSLLSGLTGLCAAAALGWRLFPVPSQATWFAAIYTFSPVFMRYNHWATGRGVFLALLPLFLIGCIEWPRLRSWVLLPLIGLLLVLSHKVGLVAVPLLAIALVLSLFVPRHDIRWLRLASVLPFLVGAILLTGPLRHSVTVFTYNAITRFGCYVPVAVLSIVLLRHWWSVPAWRRLYPAALLTFPIAFHEQMYGAMLALPFMCHAATAGLGFVFNRWPARRAALSITAAVLVSAGGLTILAHRTMSATEHRVWLAASFLEQYDPIGPFRIEAPGRARTQIQAYCSGCPRFEVEATGTAQISVHPPPSLHGPLARVVQEWISYLRKALAAGDADVSWYGNNPRFYLVTLDETGPSPTGMRLLYEEAGVRVLAPASQADPQNNGAMP